MPSLFSRLFGKSDAAPAKSAEPVLYKDCRIFPEPVREGGGYRVTARIEKDFGGLTKSHLLIRADSYGVLDEAQEASLNKAKQAIDQLGNELFRDPD